jgi:hypothetical protein
LANTLAKRRRFAVVFGFGINELLKVDRGRGSSCACLGNSLANSIDLAEARGRRIGASLNRTELSS